MGKRPSIGAWAHARDVNCKLGVDARTPRQTGWQSCEQDPWSGGGARSPFTLGEGSTERMEHIQWDSLISSPAGQTAN